MVVQESTNIVGWLVNWKHKYQRKLEPIYIFWHFIIGFILLGMPMQVNSCSIEYFVLIQF